MNNINNSSPEMSHFCPNGQHKQRHEGSTDTKKRQASKNHFFILVYNVFPLEKQENKQNRMCSGTRALYQ